MTTDHHLPITIWLTGLSGAGKTTIAQQLDPRLRDLGLHTFLLDGDVLRHGLNRDLGFSATDRRENIRRAAEVAAILNQAGVLVIAAFIAPFTADRAMARQTIGPERYLEVFVDAPLSVCEARDPKGLYRRARAGQLAEFTGISSPFEAPATPDVRLETHLLTPRACAEVLVEHLGRRFPLPA